MTSKNVGGFQLVLGLLYNEGYYNSRPPHHNSWRKCEKCDSPVTIHDLEKMIFAFGKVILKRKIVLTCPDCLNEVDLYIVLPSKPKKEKTALQRFQSLPKSEQLRLLQLASKERILK